MESVELYRQLLGLTAPWTVERVELDVERQRVEVHVGHTHLGSGLPARSVDKSCRSMTIWVSGCGATWTACSF